MQLDWCWLWCIPHALAVLTFAIYVCCSIWCPGYAYVSIDHGVHSSPESERPVFLDVAPGMTVVAKHDCLTGETAEKDWWMGEVIHCGGAARDPSMHNLFQIADVDSGVIRWVNADLVTHIIPND